MEPNPRGGKSLSAGDHRSAGSACKESPGGGGLDAATELETGRKAMIGSPGGYNE